MTAAEICHDLTDSPASYAKARRRIAVEVTGLPTVRLAVLSTCTIGTFEPVLFVEAARRGMRIEPWFGEFGQLEAPVVETGGPLYRHAPDALFIFARLDELIPDAMRRFLSLDAGECKRAAAGVAARLGNVADAFRQHSTAPVLVANFAPMSPASAGLADAGIVNSQATFIHEANALLADACRGIPGVFVFDFSGFVAAHGWRSLADPRLGHLARIPFGISGQIAFSRHLARCLRAARTQPAKVLVLDLDETLWGGIVGEDGPGGIKLGDDFPGNAYKSFHHYLLSLRDRGVLLAIASKNNEADAFEVFDHNPDCVLMRTDFAAHRINWERKSANITAIAAELNLGPDAFVFFDDNPAEREEVRSALPAVTVIEVPRDPLAFAAAIEESGAFDSLALSDEDRARPASYQARAAAAELKAASPADFLRSLEMGLTIGDADAMTLPRIVQLLGKTNQFNLTTRRHSAADVQRMIESGGIVLWSRVRDRFADHGLIAVAIALPEGKGRWRIDSLLMSCRVIGRGIEHAILAELARRAGEKGGTTLVGEYVATPKNAQVADFYPACGFAPAGNGFWEIETGRVPGPPGHFA